MIAGILLTVKTFSQTACIRGNVKSGDSITIPGAIVYIKGATTSPSCNKNCSCDKKGAFNMTNIPAGNYQLVASCIGFKTIVKQISIKENETVTFHLILEEKVTELTDVEVTAKTNEEEQKEKPGNISAINTKPFYNSTQGLNEVLKKTSGIKIRQNGGYGSNADFFLNGVSGKQIKFFIDGIPADNLGATQGINVIPVEQTERIDIYKGVVPIELGSDALGGAINIITRNEHTDYIDVSSSYSSFNTFKNNLSFKKYLAKHFYVSVFGSYNYTDNNYKVDAEVIGSQGQIEIKNVPRFHNAFKYEIAKAEIGFANTKWCNKFSIQGVYAETYNEIQHNVLMRQAYGKVNYSEKLYGATLKYQKINLLKNVHVNAFANYNKVNSLFVDTSLFVYNWDGKVAWQKSSGGELSAAGNLLTASANVLNAKAAINYTPFDFLKISIANTTQYFYRKGADPVAEKFYGFDYFKNPQQMNKNIGGVSVETKLFKKRLINSTALKYYHTAFNGNNRVDYTLTPINKQLKNIGYNTAFTYYFIKQIFVKTSYEYAIRLPDETELFGDLMLTKLNLALVPEVSKNFNASVVFNSKYIDAEATYFYRDIDNIIYLRTSQFGAQYQNLLKSNTQGVEGAIKIKPLKWLTLDGNITYQNLRNKSIIENAGINNDRYYNARLPNIPYLFANGGLNIHKDSLCHKKMGLQYYYSVSFVNEYFLYWAVDGDKSLKNVVPYQFLNYTGLSLCHYKTGLCLSFEIANIFNAKAFDNFKVQLPGRAYSLKLRWYINNKNQ